MNYTKGLSYINEVCNKLTRKYPWEKEFLQASSEVLSSLSQVLTQNPVFQKNHILERITEPERIYTFRVPWRDRDGNPQINTGYRVGFNSALGPYKGGLRFHASVSLSILKFLGFEQTFKNALTGLQLGGGKGGSDFHFRNRTEEEVENFCQSFMTALYQHIGANRDVPAGDIGVGAREIGYLFGQYRRLTNQYEGVITGKGLEWGGSILRPEATGYGVVYFLEEMLKQNGESLQGKKIAVSGFGNVAWGVCKKIEELGGTVITLSGPDGFIHDPEGIKGEKIRYMQEMRFSGRDCVEDYALHFKTDFHEKQRPWSIPCDIAIPCACENEMDLDDAKKLVSQGCRYVCEAANMPLTIDAIEYLLENKITYAPGKAANAGGVACSGFEMMQNASRVRWSAEQVDEHLKSTMKEIHRRCLEASLNYGHSGNYMAGANIASFLRVANAMLDQGHI